MYRDCLYAFWRTATSYLELGLSNRGQIDRIVCVRPAFGLGERSFESEAVQCGHRDYTRASMGGEGARAEAAAPRPSEPSCDPGANTNVARFESELSWLCYDRFLNPTSLTVNGRCPRSATSTSARSSRIIGRRRRLRSRRWRSCVDSVSRVSVSCSVRASRRPAAATLRHARQQQQYPQLAGIGVPTATRSDSTPSAEHRQGDAARPCHRRRGRSKCKPCCC